MKYRKAQALFWDGKWRINRCGKCDFEARCGVEAKTKQCRIKEENVGDSRFFEVKTSEL